MGKKFVRSVGLAAAMTALTLATGPSGTAQDKKAKKEAAKATVGISEGKDGKFRFGVRDAEGKYLGGSGPMGYATRAEAVKAIDALKAALSNAKVVDVERSDIEDEKEKMKEKEMKKEKK